MAERPAFGTAPIRCGRTRCKWRGFETDLAQVPHPTIRSATQCACPTCGSDSYMFMTLREVAAWERAKAASGVPACGKVNDGIPCSAPKGTRCPDCGPHWADIAVGVAVGEGGKQG